MPCRKTYVIPLMLFFCCLAYSSYAQQRTEKIKKTFRISRITEFKTRDTAIAFIPATPASGIEIGSSGPVYTLSGSDTYEAEIGNGFVMSSTEKGTHLYVICSKKAITDSAYMAKVGDLITLTVTVPVKSYNSIFYELEQLGITFYKKDDDPLYDFEELLKKDNSRNTDSILNICAQELHKEYDRLSKQETISEVYTKPAEAGRHKGKSIADVFKTSVPRDLLPMLRYVKENPREYRGKLYYVSYATAMWLYLKSPFSSGEMMDTLSAYSSDIKKLREKTLHYKQEIIDGGFVNNWVFQVMAEESKGNKTEADRRLKIMNTVSNVIGNPDDIGLTFACFAQINQDREDYKTAIRYCDSAIKYFQPSTQGFYLAEMHRKKGYCYSYLKMKNESIKAFEQALVVINDTATNYGYNSRNSNSAKIYAGMGDTYKDFDDFLNAVTAYKNSIRLYSLDSLYSKKLDLATVQESLGNIYKSQGSYQEAFEIYKELKNTYADVSDLTNVAYTSNSLGYVVFKQGKYEEAIRYHRFAEEMYSYLKKNGKAGFSLSQVGQAYWNLGKYDSAIAAHSKAIEYEKTDNSYGDLAYSWSNLGKLYNLIGEKNKALNAYDSSLQNYELAADSSGLLTNLYDVGKVYETDGQYQKAIGYYNKAHALNLKRNDKSELVNSYVKMGEVSYNYDTALSRKNFELSYRLSKEIGDFSNTLYSSLYLGILATRHYHYPVANRYFEEGLKLAIDQKSKTNEAWVYLRIADAETQKLDYDKAITLYNKALFIYDSLGERSQLPNIYSSIGYSFECKGDFAGSLVYFEKMKALGYELKNNAAIAGALSDMSFVYSMFGEHKKAVECADSALIIFKELNNNWQIANTYGKLGSVYGGMGEYETSVRYHLMSDSLYKAEKDDVSRSVAHNNIGVVYYFQADYDKALTYFLESDRMMKVMNTVNESVLVTRINIGEIYLVKKNYPLAEKYLTESYKLSKEKKVMRMLGVSALLLGKYAFEQNKTDEALAYFKEAREACKITNESDRIVEVEIFLGKAYERLKQNEAAAYFRSSIERGKKTRSKYLWEAYYELGIHHYNKESYDSASAYFKEAVTVIEETATKLFGGAEAKKLYAADTRKVDVYNKLVASLAKLKKTEEALYYADKSNSQAIKEKLEQSGIVTSDKEKTEALKKGSELLQKQTAIEKTLAKEKAKPEKERNNELIASLESVRKVAQEDYINFINDLVKKYPDLTSYFTKSNPADFQNYIDDIPDSTLVVLYVINDQQLYIFTVTNQETAIKVVELKEDINKHAMRLLGILKNPENATGTGAIQVRATIKSKDGIKGDFKVEASLLYDLLITPIADQLKDHNNICIIPNAALCRIPFAVLGKPDVNNRFTYLAEEFSIFYTNKMDIFRRGNPKTTISSSFVAFGNPDRSLPGATAEVNDIRDIFPNTTVYKEDDATEDKALAALKNTKYIHFATHGILDNDDFSQSYLLLNKDGVNDGKLTLSEINGLIKGETDLIFLSACEMAVPKDLGKGWDISVLNAFLSNRVRSAAGGLWQVPDEATKELIIEYYKNLKTMSRAQALRRAQATISQNPKYAHPFFWGAFVMYGEWR